MWQGLSCNILCICMLDVQWGGYSPFPLALSGTSIIYCGTYNPSTSIRGHITVDIQCLSLITIYIDGVETRGDVAIQHCLRAVPGEWVQESNCRMKRKCESGSRGRGGYFQNRLLASWAEAHFLKANSSCFSKSMFLHAEGEGIYIKLNSVEPHTELGTQI